MKKQIKEQILFLRSQGKTYLQIKEELNCSPGTISYHCSKDGKEKAKNRSKLRSLKRKKCNCGNYVKKDSLFCNKCLNKEDRRNKRQKIYNSCIKDYYKDYKGNTKYSDIRRLARVFMEETKTEKSCKICGFNDYVELCHIKAIKDFDKNSKISDVNNLNNLVYLCPNHHKLLDIGKIKLEI